MSTNANETMARIITQAEALAELKAQIKSRSMIYQVQTKEDMAQFWGLPFDTFYDLSYQEFEEWAFRYRLESDLAKLRSPVPFEYLAPHKVVTEEASLNTFTVRYEPETEILGTIHLDGTIWYGTNNQGVTKPFIWYIYALSFVVHGEDNRPDNEVENFIQAHARNRQIRAQNCSKIGGKSLSDSLSFGPLL
jgi:hypothetical protein